MMTLIARPISVANLYSAEVVLGPQVLGGLRVQYLVKHPLQQIRQPPVPSQQLLDPLPERKALRPQKV